MLFRNIDTRIVNIGISPLLGFIEAFFQEEGFSIVRKIQLSSEGICFYFEPSEKSFWKLLTSKKPYVIKCTTLSENSNCSKIELRFRRLINFQLKFFLTLFIFFMVSIISCKLLLSNFITIQTLTEIKGAMISFVSLAVIFVVVILVSILLCIKCIDNSNGEITIDRFYKKCKDIWKNKIITISTPVIFPNYIEILIAWLIFILSFLFIFKVIDTTLLLLLSPLIIVFMVLLFLLFTFSFKNTFSLRAIFPLMGIGANAVLFFYFLFPFASAAIFSDLIPKLNKLLEIRESSSYDIFQTGILEYISVFYLLPFLTLLILSLYIFYNNLGALPEKINEKLKQFKQQYSESVWYKALLPDKYSWLFNFSIYLFWILFSILNIIGLFLCFSLFEYSVFNKNYLFSNVITTALISNFITFLGTVTSLSPKLITAVTKIIMFIYVLPIIMLVGIVIQKKLIQPIRDALIKKTSVQNEKNILERLFHICKFVGIKAPILKIIDSPFIGAKSSHNVLPFSKRILMITKGTLDQLTPDELEGLLAHEIWHLKKHSFKFAFLNFLSNWTLFGNGFLAVTQNSFKAEFEADDFAVEWLKVNNISIKSFKSLLIKTETVNFLLKNQSKEASSGLAFLKDSKKTIEEKNRILKSSWIQKIKNNLKIFYNIYFGDKILSYFHPSISDRIARIKQKEEVLT